VPMLVAGDEMSRTQQGNNNAYCQDNEISWLNWHVSDEDKELIEFVGKIIKIRKNHAVFRRRYFVAPNRKPKGEPFIWCSPSGHRMHSSDWQKGYVKCVSVMMPGNLINELGSNGEEVIDDSFIVMFNAHWETVTFTIPSSTHLINWHVFCDTSKDKEETNRTIYHPRQSIKVAERSILILCCERDGAEVREEKHVTLPDVAVETASSSVI